jgi:beta-galactosidase
MRWADGLIADGAHVLVGYEHPHFGQWSTATTRVHGAGRITVVGTVPNTVLAHNLFQWVAAHLPKDRWRSTQPSITTSSALNDHGDILHFVHNWSWEPTTFVIPAAADDVLSGDEYSAETELRLGPWDVRVLLTYQEGAGEAMPD